LFNGADNAPAAAAPLDAPVGSTEIVLVPAGAGPLAGGSARHIPRGAPEAAYLAGLSASGRRSMAARLRTVARLLGASDYDAVAWEDLRVEHITAIKTALGDQGLSPASINATLAALRGVAQAAWSLHYLPVDDLERIRRIKPAKGSRLPAGRAVKAGELRALLDACTEAGNPTGIRDAAVIAVLYAAGLRRSELAGLQLADYDPPTRALTIRHGKGDKERIVYLPTGAAAALEEWLARRGQAAGSLFVPINKGGKLGSRALSAQAVYMILTERAKQAALTKPLSPHDMRRSYVGDLLDAGADISTVRQLAGHADVSTTARYDRRGEETKKKAADLLHVPYSRPCTE
jgi:site-specific recombinase XerD